MGYANGQAPKSALVQFEGCWCSPDMAARLAVAVPRIEARGASIIINQVYRFLGTVADRSIGIRDTSGDESLASTTSTGDGNQYYQAGRAANGSTPSAATPGLSNHGDWETGAVDSNCSDIAIRDEEFRAVGLIRNISSESWHAAGLYPFTAPLSTPTIGIDMALPTTKSVQPYKGQPSAYVYLEAGRPDRVVNRDEAILLGEQITGENADHLQTITEGQYNTLRLIRGQ